jgi:prolyl-tRNA editing enzyme YbaK/EbsC (Cys-tRNA(Pro) deacylase)
VPPGPLRQDGRVTTSSTATPVLGSLSFVPVTERPDLLGASVLDAAHDLPQLARAWVCQIDPAVSDTAALVAAHGVPAGASANCVIVAGRRQGVERLAACLVLATTRADINGQVRRLLDVRKASFLPMERAVAETGMEHGAITPVGLPTGWRLLVDARVVAATAVLVGSGVRQGKLLLPGELLATLPGAEVVDGLAVATS